MKKYEELGYNGLEGKQGIPRGRPKIMTKKEKTNEEHENDLKQLYEVCPELKEKHDVWVVIKRLQEKEITKND